MAAMTPFSDDAIIQTLQAMPDAVLAVDSSGIIAFTNHHVDLLTGYTRSELVGKSVDVLVPTSRRETHTHQRSGYQEVPSAREMGARRDLQLRTKSGSLIPVTISLYPLDGSGVGVVLATVREGSARERRSKADILVAEIGRIVNSGLEIQGVYEAVVDSIPALVKYDRLAINLNEPASGLVNRVFVSGVTVPGGEVGTSGPPPTDALTSPGPLPGSSLSGVPVGSDPLMKSMAATGLNSWVEVPLGNPDEPIGYLSLRSLEMNTYGEDDLNILMRVVAYISPAIENGLLYAQAQKEAHENATLAEISRIITAMADIEDVYSLVAEQIQEIVPFDRIVVATIDRSRNLVTDRYVAGLMVEGGESKVTYPPDDSTVGHMENDLTARSLSRDEVEDLATRYPSDKSRIEAGLQSMLTAPLIWNDEVIGRLIMRSMKENAYGDAEAVIAVRIANQISGAVANAELAERTLRDNEEKVALAEISRIITSTSEIRRFMT